MICKVYPKLGALQGVNPSSKISQSILSDLAALIQVIRCFDPEHVLVRQTGLLHRLMNHIQMGWGGLRGRKSFLSLCSDYINSY